MENTEELAGQIKEYKFLYEEESQTFYLFDLGDNWTLTESLENSRMLRIFKLSSA